MLTLGVVTDLHFGPEARFEGKLRKLTSSAERLADAFVTEMNEIVRPDLVVNLGDDIEDESPELDEARYRRCLGVLSRCHAPTLHVVGNHDSIHLSDERLAAAWRDTDGVHPACRAAPELRYSLDAGGVHVTVLRSRERKDVEVFLGDDELVWLDADLARAARPSVVFVHHSLADQRLEHNRWFDRWPHLCLARDRARAREILLRHDVRLVMNGHLHWNHLDVHGGVPFVTLQSLVENLDDDAPPGRPARAHAVVRVDDERVEVDVRGAEPARYHFAHERVARR